MTKNTITCKKCGSEIEISEALTHQIKEQVLASIDIKHKEELEAVKKEAEELSNKKAAEHFDAQLKTLEKENTEEMERNKKLREQLDQLLEEVRKLRRKDEEREIEMKKKILEEEEKIRGEAVKKTEEVYRLKDLEKEKKLSDALKQVEELKTRMQQGSQQMQGEVLELDLEEKLRSTFPNDEITGVAKGALGADILQKVRNTYGKTAGSILWEGKRAKWTPSWLPKLREDTRKAGAIISILVCENIPAEIEGFKMIEGVIVTSYRYAIPLAALLRINVMQIAAAKSTAINIEEKLQHLHTYLQSDAFKTHFEAFAEGIVAMQQDLETEKRSTQRIWKKREMDIKKMIGNVVNMYGELQSIMGKSLPEIKILELPSGGEEH